MNFEPKFGGGRSEGPPFLDEGKKIKEYVDMIVSQKNVSNVDKMATAEKMAKTFSPEGGQELIHMVDQGIKSTQARGAQEEGQRGHASSKEDERIWRESAGGKDPNKWR